MKASTFKLLFLMIFMSSVGSSSMKDEDGFTQVSTKKTIDSFDPKDI